MIVSSRRHWSPVCSLARLGGVVALVAGLGSVAPLQAIADAFVVTQWDVFCSVQRSSTSEHHTVFFDTVENPFVNQHAVTLPSNPATSAAAQYDFAWAEQFGRFLVQAQNATRDGSASLTQSVASGSILVQAHEDLTFSCHSVYSYSCPATYLDVSTTVIVSSETTQQTLYLDGRAGGPFIGGPPAGTLTFSGGVLLPAGDTYRLRYSAQILSFGGNSDVVGTGGGFIDLQLTPEPASLALLALSLFVVRRRPARGRG